MYLDVWVEIMAVDYLPGVGYFHVRPYHDILDLQIDYVTNTEEILLSSYMFVDVETMSVNSAYEIYVDTVVFLYFVALACLLDI